MQCIMSTRSYGGSILPWACVHSALGTVLVQAAVQKRRQPLSRTWDGSVHWAHNPPRTVPTSQSNTSRLAAMRCGCTDLGSTLVPRCTAQRIKTWAGQQQVVV